MKPRSDLADQRAAAQAVNTEANVAAELTFTARGAYADPFNDVTLDVMFRDPQGRELRVPAFWAGGAVWKARYASPAPGTHTFHSECAEARDAGLNGVRGRVEVTPYRGENPLYRHGPLRIAPDRRHLEHADGTPFFWLGDTWWMGLCHRLRWPEDFQRLAADRKAKGFNVVQIVAGLYPDMPAFDPRGANEAGFPWEENYARIRPEYFDAADARLGHLVGQGIAPCLVGAWGYFIPWMGVAKMRAHWRYLIARYGAWPVTWCVAGEANLPWYLAPNFPCDDRAQVHEWTKIIRHVRATDPFRRPLTIHPTAINRYTARNATEDAALLDFDLLQTPHAQNEAVPVAIGTVRECRADTPTMPVINGEPCYEMLGDSLTTAWPRRMFWVCLLNGAAGHTYGANGIWQVNRPGQPHGASPHGGNYGLITWEEAMRLPGSQQMGFGKKLFERYPWHRFEPHPEWAEFADFPWLSLAGAQWIWPDRAQPPATTPNRRGYFRRVFELPAGRGITRAHLRLAASNHAEARLNGAPAGTGWDRRTGAQFEDLARLLRPGRNALTLWIEHRPATGDPVGLLACLEIILAGGETLRLTSDGSWRCAGREVSGWEQPDFDDRDWIQPEILGRAGDAPWGEITAPGMEFFGPQAAGIPGVVRIIYVPQNAPVMVRHLGAGARWSAAVFDPVNGTTAAPAVIRADAEGAWRRPPPAGQDHDWVLVLEAVAPAEA